MSKWYVSLWIFDIYTVIGQVRHYMFGSVIPLGSVWQQPIVFVHNSCLQPITNGFRPGVVHLRQAASMLRHGISFLN